MSDLFGDPIYNAPANVKTEQAGLFDAGNAWLLRRDEFLSETGLRLEATGMNQSFRAGGAWFVVERGPDGENRVVAAE